MPVPRRDKQPDNYIDCLTEIQGQFLNFEKFGKVPMNSTKRDSKIYAQFFLLNLLTKIEIWYIIVIVRISLYEKEEEERP